MTGANTSPLTFTENHQLRSGTYPWQDGEPSALSTDPLPDHAIDVAIIGAGIMGSILAERLSASGRSIVVVDRRAPCRGSTLASTAQVMWAMDVPLLHYARRVGEEAAGHCWQRVSEAVQGLERRIRQLGINCGLAERSTVYLAGNVLDAAGLQQEAVLRARYHLPSGFLGADAVAERFDIAPRAALVSSGDFEIDPLRLSEELLREARSHGARVVFPQDVRSLAPEGSQMALTLEGGRVLKARDVIVASGYERAWALLPAQFRLGSTFAIATAPGTALLWKEHAMIWEAADPYLYVRTDSAGRVIAGGEDIDSFDPTVRDAVREEKAGIILAKLERLLGSGPLAIDRSWAATFGYSPDGLPAIGRSSLMPRVWLAAGFGGNGISFAGLASEILEAGLSGRNDPCAPYFDPYRFT